MFGSDDRLMRRQRPRMRQLYVMVGLALLNTVGAVIGHQIRANHICERPTERVAPAQLPEPISGPFGTSAEPMDRIKGGTFL